MIGAVTLLLAAAEWLRTPLISPFEESEAVVVRELQGDLPRPKLSPIGGWSFDLLSDCCLARLDGDAERIRVFSQSYGKPGFAPASAARLLARLFEFNYNQLKLDHSFEFNKQRVDVYLCSQGDPGGQQRFLEDNDETDSYGRPVKVNTVHIYQAGTLADRIEALRELAHEYGHATLPPVKVKGGREEWANGHLGERIYLAYLRRQLLSGKLTAADALGCSEKELGEYLARKSEPLVAKLALKGPSPATLADTTDKGFEAYLAMACYAFECLPVETFRRSLVLNPDQSPPGYLKALLEALGERKVVNLRKPAGVAGAEWWVPMGGGKLVGGKIVESRAGWSRIRATGSVAVKNEGAG